MATAIAKALNTPRLKQMVEDHDCRAGKVFDLCVQVLIVTSLVSFSIETQPGLSPRAYALLHAVETATVLLFTLEYALRIYVATSKRRYVFSFFGLVDLFAILPFYIASGVDLRTLRMLRLLRLIRLFKLLRYTAASQRFHRAFLIAKEELLLCFFVAMILLYLAAVGIYYFEHEAQPDSFGSIFDSLWWATATLTTVGYGDIYPITVGGRVFTCVVLIVGLGIISVPAGLVAAALIRARDS
jgi:voltage-gated potassium channel